MRVPPYDLDTDRLHRALATGWDLHAVDAEYLPVGFGSHHWRITDRRGTPWFVTVDETGTPGERARLAAALASAAALRDHGLEFVLAPIRSGGGPVVLPVPDRFAVAVYPLVSGTGSGFGERWAPGERDQVLRLLERLHAVPPSVVPRARADDLVVTDQRGLERALTELDRVWTGGPSAEWARGVVTDRRAEIEQVLRRYRALAAAADRHRDGWVVTHGEPHPGNVVADGSGLLLCDWDTLLIGPPERDLWHLDEDGDGYSATLRTGGRPADPEVIELYRLGWRVADIATAVTWLRGPHHEDADTELNRQILLAATRPTA